MINYDKIVLLSSKKYFKKSCIYAVNTFGFVDPSYLLKRKVIDFNWVKAARGSSLKIYKCSESVFKP